MKSGKAGDIGKGIDGYIFRAVVVDIAADSHEFFDILMLFVGYTVGIIFAGVKAGAANRDKKADHQRIDQSFRESGLVGIFMVDFFQKGTQHAVKFRIFVAPDQRIGLQGRKQGVSAVDVADQSVIEQNDQTLPTEVGGVKSDGVKFPAG